MSVLVEAMLGALLKCQRWWWWCCFIGWQLAYNREDAAEQHGPVDQQYRHVLVDL